MEPTIHPLLSLVESNRNGLKSLLTHHINDTVDYQFDQLKNTLLKMILKGLINPLYEDTDENDKFTPFTQTNSPTCQANFDHENSPSILHHSNDHLTPTHEQNIIPSADVHENTLDSIQPNATDQVNSSNNEQCPLISVNDNEATDADTEVDMQIGFGHDEIEQDQQNASHDPMVISDVIDDDTNQSAGNTNDLSILINESEQICSNQKANTTTNQPVNIEHIQQSIPSTSTGLRSSDRKQIQRKLFGDVVRSNENEMEDYKRKSVTQSSNKVKKVKHLEEEVEEEKEDDKEVEDKFQVVTIEVNCTETGCKNKKQKSFKMWKQHLFSIHGHRPYELLRSNFRLNQHGQTEYPCTDCAAVPKSQYLLSQHWRRYHLAGKFQCSVCEFVGNLWGKVWNHYQKAHFAGKFRCTQEGCDQTFKSMPHLANHQRIHTGETPYKCTWHNCKVSFNQIGSAIKHVRTKHFHLPRTVREQKELNIIDQRDAKMYVKVSRG